jgi:general secretion pathway protein I
MVNAGGVAARSLRTLRLCERFVCIGRAVRTRFSQRRKVRKDTPQRPSRELGTSSPVWLRLCRVTERSRPVRLIRPQHTTRRGFTLLEVLVAAVIMGLAVAGAMSAIASSSRNASRLTQYDRAVTLARQKMNELLVDRNAPRNVPLSGNWDPGIPNAGWNARVTPFEAPPGMGVGGGVLDRVELEIWWMDGQTRRAFTLEGFRRNMIRPGDVIPGGVNAQ